MLFDLSTSQSQTRFSMSFGNAVSCVQGSNSASGANRWALRHSNKIPVLCTFRQILRKEMRTQRCCNPPRSDRWESAHNRLQIASGQPCITPSDHASFIRVRCALPRVQMGLSVELCRALADMNINTPTAIQKASLPVSLAGESVLLCAETGSGKSLAFLLPLVSRLKSDELARGIIARPKRPRAIVLAPTRELAAQLLGVAKGLSRHAKFSSVGVLGGSSMAAQAKRLNQPVDLVVATPGRCVYVCLCVCARAGGCPCRDAVQGDRSFDCHRVRVHSCTPRQA